MIDEKDALFKRLAELLDGLSAVTISGSTLNNQNAVLHYFREWENIRPRVFKLVSEIEPFIGTSAEIR